MRYGQEKWQEKDQTPIPPFPVIPAKAGIQKRTFRRNAPFVLICSPSVWRERAGFPPSRE
jgi:hypothetical protein